MRLKLQEFNEDLSKRNVAKVTSMYDMFSEAKAFNPDISGWDVSNVKTFTYMFHDVHSFHHVDGTERVMERLIILVLRIFVME